MKHPLTQVGETGEEGDMLIARGQAAFVSHLDGNHSNLSDVPLVRDETKNIATIGRFYHAPIFY